MLWANLTNGGKSNALIVRLTSSSPRCSSSNRYSLPLVPRMTELDPPIEICATLWRSGTTSASDGCMCQTKELPENK